MDFAGREMLMIHNPATIAWGDSGEMQKAIEMLESVKDSIINAYEIKTGLSRTKLSHMMDAETWMDAGKAVELGFADGILKRSEVPDDMEPPAVSMLYSEAAAVNSLMDKIAAKCRTKPKTEPMGRSVDQSLRAAEFIEELEEDMTMTILGTERKEGEGVGGSEGFPGFPQE